MAQTPSRKRYQSMPRPWQQANRCLVHVDSHGPVTGRRLRVQEVAPPPNGVRLRLCRGAGPISGNLQEKCFFSRPFLGPPLSYKMYWRDHFGVQNVAAILAPMGGRGSTFGAAGDPLLGRILVPIWALRNGPQTPQKRTPGRPSGPRWRPHFGC